MEVEEYKKAVREMLAQEGAEAANDANHAALEKGLISMEQFRAGAQILAMEILKR